MTASVNVQTAETAGSKRRADGWWYPYIYVVGMVVVIAVNALMIYFATSTFTGLTHDDYYRRGAEFNKTLAEREAMAALGWRVNIDLQAAPVGNPSRLQALFLDVSDAGVSGLTVEALILRPTHKGHDANITFRETDAGRYVAEHAFPLPGQWEIRMQATRGEDKFAIVRRLEIP
ncbi:MAG: FixH family protein [Magnetovibrionaceae bacterium]